jgi:hypothetical protein
LGPYLTVYFQELGGETAKGILAFRSAVVKGMVDTLQENFNSLNETLGKISGDDLINLQNSFVIANQVSQRVSLVKEFLSVLNNPDTSLLLKSIGLSDTKMVLVNSVQGTLESLDKIVTSENSGEAVKGIVKLKLKCVDILNNINKANENEVVVHSENFVDSCSKALEIPEEFSSVVEDLSSKDENIDWKKVGGVVTKLGLQGYVLGKKVEDYGQKFLQDCFDGDEEEVKEKAEKYSRVLVQGGATTFTFGYAATGSAICPPWAMIMLGGYVIGRSLDFYIDYAFDSYIYKTEYEQGGNNKKIELFLLYKKAIQYSYRENFAKVMGNNNQNDLYQEGKVIGNGLVQQLLNKSISASQLKDSLKAIIDEKSRAICEKPINPFFKVKF